MASVTLTIPDAQVQRYIDAFTLPYGDTATAAHAKARLIEVCKMYVREYEQRVAAQAAIDAVTEITPT